VPHKYKRKRYRKKYIAIILPLSANAYPATLSAILIKTLPEKCLAGGRLKSPTALSFSQLDRTAKPINKLGQRPKSLI
jgi:hypothetical protein